jgi:hypothetical protein
VSLAHYNNKPSSVESLHVFDELYKCKTIWVLVMHL